MTRSKLPGTNFLAFSHSRLLTTALIFCLPLRTELTDFLSSEFALGFARFARRRDPKLHPTQSLMTETSR